MSGSNIAPARPAAYRSAGLLLNEESVLALLIEHANLELEEAGLAIRPTLLRLQKNARRILEAMNVEWKL